MTFLVKQVTSEVDSDSKESALKAEREVSSLVKGVVVKVAAACIL